MLLAVVHGFIQLLNAFGKLREFFFTQFLARLKHLRQLFAQVLLKGRAFGIIRAGAVLFCQAAQGMPSRALLVEVSLHLRVHLFGKTAQTLTHFVAERFGIFFTQLIKAGELGRVFSLQPRAHMW